MPYERRALWILFVLCLAPASAFAQDRTASLAAFGGMSPNSVSSSFTGIDFGVDVAKELTPNIQVVGEVGRIADMLPSLTSTLVSLTPYDVRVSAFYGEGGIRLLAAPGGGVNPYAEATAGIARLTPHVSGFGAFDPFIEGGLNLFRSTDPVLGLGGGVLLRGGPVVADLGYRYKQVAGADSLASLLGAGDRLRSHQLRFGIGVRF